MVMLFQDEITYLVPPLRITSTGISGTCYFAFRRTLIHPVSKNVISYLCSNNWKTWSTYRRLILYELFLTKGPFWSWSSFSEKLYISSTPFQGLLYVFVVGFPPHLKFLSSFFEHFCCSSIHIFYQSVQLVKQPVSAGWKKSAHCFIIMTWSNKF